MNKRELLDTILKNYPEFSKLNYKEAEAILGLFIKNIKEHVKQGEEVSFVGFGTFSKAVRHGRNVFNPKTKEQIFSKEKNVPAFKPSQFFKDYL